MPSFADPPIDLDIPLVQAIEEAILFGKIEAIDPLLDRMAAHELISQELRHGIESLRYFRAHYAAESPNLSPEARQRVIRMDADWTMHLLQQLHPTVFGTVETRRA